MSKKHDLTMEEKTLLDALLLDVQPVAVKTRAASAAKKPLTKRKILTTNHLPFPTTLDLHGLTVASAHSNLVAFITAHYQQKSRKITVITGKSGELARDVPRWLTLTNLATMVASITQAEPHRGGAGALIVKLKKHD